MGIFKHLGHSALLTLLVLGANLAPAQETGLRLVGLGLHRDTGRDIYLGAIHIDPVATRPDNFLTPAAPWAMEYRIVARRTSIRSLLGNMLMQSEMATGGTASPAAIEFADTLMANMRGSLYAGDSLQIQLTAQGNTKATLNGAQLAYQSGPNTAQYFLQGWVDANSANSAFREALLNPEIDPRLIAQYDIYQVSPERIAIVNDWAPAEPVAQQQETDEPPELASSAAAPAAEDPEDTPGLDAEIDALATVTEGTELLSTAAAEDTTSPVTATTQQAPDEAIAIDTAAPTATTQLALATPAAGLIEQAESPHPVDDISAVDYAQRLSDFNTALITKVYDNIRYPSAAVKRNIQGSLELDLTLSRSGDFQSIAIARSSGSGLLDNAAERAALKAFKKVPLDVLIDAVAIAEYAQGEVLVVPLPISFVLTE